MRMSRRQQVPSTATCTAPPGMIAPAQIPSWRSSFRRSSNGRRRQERGAKRRPPNIGSMIDRDRALAVAHEWLDAWNAHDPERVIAHFAKDVIVVSPLLEQLRPQSKGVISGKGEVLEY